MQDMSIWLIWLVFPMLCGVVSLIGITQPQEPKRVEVNYQEIYRALSPKEL